MRRPEVAGFIAISPPANMFDFGFLAPCPVSGLMVQGTADEIVPTAAVTKLVTKLSVQREILVKYQTVEGANHFFTDHIEQLTRLVGAYVDQSNAFEIKREPVRLRGQPAPMQPPSDIPKISKKLAENRKLAVVTSTAGGRRSPDDSDSDETVAEPIRPMVKSIAAATRTSKVSEPTGFSRVPPQPAKPKADAKVTKVAKVAKPKKPSAGKEKSPPAAPAAVKASAPVKLTLKSLRSKLFGASK